MPTKEEWLRHRFHEASHSAVAWLEGGASAVSAINQSLDHKGRLVGHSGVSWRELENGSMACVAVAGVLGEAKGHVFQSGHLDSTIVYSKYLMTQLQGLFVKINSGSVDEAWPFPVQVSPLVEKSEAVISKDDLRRISDPYKTEKRLEFIIKRSIEYLNREDVFEAVRAVADEMSEQLPWVMHRDEVRAILGHYLPNQPVPFAFWLGYEMEH
jgi:hypothetical protein